jgi:hypothetical protein
MARSRPRILLTAASIGLMLSVVLVTARGQQYQGVDPERGFSFGDTDLDGKLTLDEFRDLLQNAPRFKNAAAKKAPANLEALFRRLDLDRDGVLVFVEYRQMSQLGPGGGGPGVGPFAKARAKAKASASASAASAREVAERRSTPEQARFFESKIRPVLATKCASCHSAGAEKLKGGLRVDSRAGLLKGGDTGPAVVPGHLD